MLPVALSDVLDRRSGRMRLGLMDRDCCRILSTRFFMNQALILAPKASTWGIESMTIKFNDPPGLRHLWILCRTPGISEALHSAGSSMEWTASNESASSGKGVHIDGLNMAWRFGAALNDSGRSERWWTSLCGQNAARYRAETGHTKCPTC